jgi:hypothetical protein
MTGPLTKRKALCPCSDPAFSHSYALHDLVAEKQAEIQASLDADSEVDSLMGLLEKHRDCMFKIRGGAHFECGVFLRDGLVKTARERHLKLVLDDWLKEHDERVQA